MSILNQDQRKIVHATIDEQERLCANLRLLAGKQPWTETYFFLNPALNGVASIVSAGIIYWRAAFRGFGLSKYSKGRMVTPVLAIIASSQAAIIHKIYVHSDLELPYNDHSMLSYCRKTALAHCYVLTTSFIMSTGYSFVTAIRSRVIPVPDRFLAKENRAVAFKIYFGSIRPYAKSIVIATAVSQAAMILFAALEYRQYKNLLAKFNRKYIYEKTTSSTL